VLKSERVKPYSRIYSSRVNIPSPPHGAIIVT